MVAAAKTITAVPEARALARHGARHVRRPPGLRRAGADLSEPLPHSPGRSAGGTGCRPAFWAPSDTAELAPQPSDARPS